MSASAQNLVLYNPDLLREIDKFIEPKLPFILSCKLVKESLKPLLSEPNEPWITSYKRYFTTSISLVEFALSFGCEFILENDEHNLPCYAASNGCIEVISWFFNKYPLLDDKESYYPEIHHTAARYGHLEVLQYMSSLTRRLLDNDEIDMYSVGFAAKHGHLHILKWFKLQKPSFWVSDICAFAAAGNQLNILKWLRSSNDVDKNVMCPWDSDTTTFAAYNGFLEVLQWVRAQNPPCPWLKQNCLNNARNGNFIEMIEWIQEQED